MAATLTPRITRAARVDEIPRGFRLMISPGPSGRYRLAQLDDYAKLARRDFTSLPPLSLSLRARASAESVPGTWGFGLWNDPFGLSLGFGGSPFRLPALPNAVWFFQASNENHLSLGDRSGNGFLVQAFRSPRFHPLLVSAGFILPFSRKMTRHLLGRVIEEDGVRINVDVTQWHRYKLDWSPKRVSFEVDGAQVFESPVSPKPPLGTVIWIDNQYAAFTPDGKLGFGVLENPEPAWLEIEEVLLL